MAEAGAVAGAAFVPAAPVMIPVGAILFGALGAAGGAEMGEFIGDVVCPY